MLAAAELQIELTLVLATLHRRRASTGEAAERKALTRLIARLGKTVSALEGAAPLGTAERLADAIERLETAVAAARHGPFDGYLSALEGHFARLSALSGALHAGDALAPTPAFDDATALATDDAEARELDALAPRQPRERSAGWSPSTATDFATLRDEYAAWYADCEVRSERRGEVAYYVRRLRQGQPTYAQLGAELSIPWAFIGVIHALECGFNFTTHLHNGDPLGARTVRVPAGRPLAGTPPFTWSQSARDALMQKGYHQIDDWSVAHMLYLLERYNGMGYRRRGVPTPYLWSFSNVYEKGKFVADGRFDAEAVSRQCGAVPMLKAVLN